MSKKFLSAIVAAAAGLSACTPLPDDYAGNVVDFNGRFVVIEGAWDGTSAFEPTLAMTAQARELCAPSEAKFVGATAKDDGFRQVVGPFGTSYVSGTDAWPMNLFRFACVQS